MTIDIKSMGYVRVASTDLDQWTLFASRLQSELPIGEAVVRQQRNTRRYRDTPPKR